jgi:hypothetical protein
MNKKEATKDTTAQLKTLEAKLEDLASKLPSNLASDLNDLKAAIAQGDLGNLSAKLFDLEKQIVQQPTGGEVFAQQLKVLRGEIEALTEAQRLLYIKRAKATLPTVPEGHPQYRATYLVENRLAPEVQTFLEGDQWKALEPQWFDHDDSAAEPPMRQTSLKLAEVPAFIEGLEDDEKKNPAILIDHILPRLSDLINHDANEGYLFNQMPLNENSENLNKSVNILKTVLNNYQDKNDPTYGFSTKDATLQGLIDKIKTQQKSNNSLEAILPEIYDYLKKNVEATVTAEKPLFEQHLTRLRVSDNLVKEHIKSPYLWDHDPTKAKPLTLTAYYANAKVRHYGRIICKGQGHAKDKSTSNDIFYDLKVSLDVLKCLYSRTQPNSVYDERNPFILTGMIEHLLDDPRAKELDSLPKNQQAFLKGMQLLRDCLPQTNPETGGYPAFSAIPDIAKAEANLATFKADPSNSTEIADIAEAFINAHNTIQDNENEATVATYGQTMKPLVKNVIDYMRKTLPTLNAE